MIRIKVFKLLGSLCLCKLPESHSGSKQASHSQNGSRDCTGRYCFSTTFKLWNPTGVHDVARLSKFPRKVCKVSKDEVVEVTEISPTSSG